MGRRERKESQWGVEKNEGNKVVCKWTIRKIHHAASNCDFQFGHQTSHPNSWSLLLRPHLFMCVQSGVQQLGRKVIICLFVDSLLRERRGEGLEGGKGH